MFLNHAAAFDACKPVAPQRPTSTRPPRRAAFAAGTLIDTSVGWRPVEDLRPGDLVQTFDGGMVALAAVTRQEIVPAPRWHVPAGALDNCSDFHLTGEQFVGLRGRMAQRIFGVPVVIAPASALAGFRGIARTGPAANRLQVALSFASEDLAMAQTGTLLHVPGQDRTRYFHRLDFGQTRSLLALMDPQNCRPDLGPALAVA